MSDEETSSKSPIKPKQNSIKELEKELWKKVKSGEWKVRPVTIGGIYKAQYYKILHLVFDKKNNRVFNWYICSRCRMAIYLNMNVKGNKNLKKHACYIDFLREQENVVLEQADMVHVSVDESLEEDADDQLSGNRDDEGNLFLPSIIFDEFNDNECHSDITEDEIAMQDIENSEADFNVSDTEASVANSGNANQLLSQQSLELSHDEKQSPKLYSDVCLQLSQLFANCRPFSITDIQNIWPVQFDCDGM